MHTLLNQAHLLREIGFLLEELDEKFFRIINDDADVLVYESILPPEIQDRFSISFVFWLKQNRVSFFLFDREIADEYLVSETQSAELVSFLRVVLTNEVKRELIYSGNELKKERLVYSSLHNGMKTQVSETITRKFIFPWTSTNKTVHAYQKWLG